MKPNEILHEMAKTFEERNAVYGSNYKNVAPVMEALFPDGVPSRLVLTHRWHLFELMIVKLTRFANSGLTHQDSVHDLCVYGAMVESLLPGPPTPLSASYGHGEGKAQQRGAVDVPLEFIVGGPDSPAWRKVINGELK